MKIVFSLLLLGLCITACKKEQPDLTTLNNCSCANEVSADFKMGQFFDSDLIDLDTVHYYMYYEPDGTFHLDGNCYISFSANDANAMSYEWQVGNNSSSQTTKDFGLYFDDTVGTIPVRLIIHSTPNTICFPDDDGIDTVTRYLTVRSMPQPYLIGKFKGYNTDNPAQEFIIEIDTFHPENSNFITYGIKNLPTGNTFDKINSFNTVSFNGTTESGSTTDGGGFIQFTGQTKGLFNSATNQLRVTYSARYYNSSFSQILQELTNKTFVGIKL